MSPITHFLMGWAAANAVPSLGKRDRALVTWSGVEPDIDGLGIIADGLTRNSSHPLQWWGDYHHFGGVSRRKIQDGSGAETCQIQFDR
jgi:hypothetical protein